MDELSPADALNLCERNWRHIDRASMEPAERALLQALWTNWAEDACLFERPHHRRIAAVLEALGADVRAANVCLFGGGTAMALR